MDTVTPSKDLALVFKRLRRMGLIARMNYLCCGGCAGSQIATDAVDRVKKGKLVNGTCFYHRQDNERHQNGYSLYLRFGCLDTVEMGKIGLPTVEVGKMITKVLTEEGIAFEWDGTAEAAIKVTEFAHREKGQRAA